MGTQRRDLLRTANGRSAPDGPRTRTRTGPNTLTIGDAAGTVNPFNGEGIAYGYETGRLAANVVATALLHDDSSLLPLYDELLESAYGDYYKVARRSCASSPNRRFSRSA